MQKKYILMILVLCLLAAGISAAPAAARDVSPGSTIFVYEDGLNFTGDLSDAAQLQYKSNNNVLNMISVQDPNNFNLLASSVGDYTGSWDVINSSGTKLGTVLIYYPDLSIDIVLAKDGVSSVQEWVIFKGADGSETTYASGNSFADIHMDSVQILTSQFFLPKDLGKTTTIYAEWSDPTSFHNYAEKSNSITMEYNDVTDPGVSITTNPTPTSTISVPSVTETTAPPTTMATTPTPVETTSEPTTGEPTPSPTESSLPAFLAPLSLLGVLILFRR